MQPQAVKIFDTPDRAFVLKTPKDIEELDISLSLVEDIMLRHLYTKSVSSISKLCNSIKLTFSIVQNVFQGLRQQQLFEVTDMKGNDYYFTLSGKGRELAAKRFNISHYCGPAPVSVKSYHAVVKAQIADLKTDRSSLKSALSDLVLTNNIIDQLGPALISQKPIFLYGPTGNGKTSIANRLIRVLQDPILIPYAVEYDGQIIVLYDPSVHERVSSKDSEHDPRLVLCRRPCIIAGGELEPKMLELRIEESTNVYAAPMQMKANNGILIIDDLGRQLISPELLLNRWIVPLDRRVDYLTLQYGAKFMIPFEMIVVFSTNLNPSQLADEAFLRRLKNKIYVGPINTEVFDQIFNHLVRERNLSSDPDSAAFLRSVCLKLGAKNLQACVPRDILDIVASINSYEQLPHNITKEHLNRAASLYFTKPKTIVADM
jgi:hypothetical protein